MKESKKFGAGDGNETDQSRPWSKQVLPSYCHDGGNIEEIPLHGNTVSVQYYCW